MCMYVLHVREAVEKGVASHHRQTSYYYLVVAVWLFLRGVCAQTQNVE